MNYIPPSSVKIEDKRWIKLADYLYNRFLELFWTTEEIEEFAKTKEIVDKSQYINRMKNSVDWVLSYNEYKLLMDTIVSNMPKRFSKRKAKQVLSIIDFYMWPKLIEQANEEKLSAK